ncbi:hypothetical protein M0Q50_06840 [bacterium]|jgi:hypothetical protein|nr:hypothetical protein [bacterium]
MKTYSLENIGFDSFDNVYNIFEKTVVDNKLQSTFTTIVQPGEEMRMDKICERLYGDTELTEELMVLNNILCEWNINVGDEILCFSSVEYMREYDDTKDSEKVRTSLTNPSKNTKKDPNRSENLSPIVKPKTLKVIDVDYDNNKIKIMNKFQ